MSSISDAVLGIAVEGLLLILLVGTFYRVLAGRFLIPKRQSILPYECGVIVRGTETIKTVGPGTCWVRPKHRVVLCDMRPRPLQMIGIEVLGNDGGIVRLSLSGEYHITDPAVFISVSREAANTFVAATRKALFDAVREQNSMAVIASPELLIARLKALIEPISQRLGMDFINLEIWEVMHRGWVQQPPEEATTVPLLH